MEWLARPEFQELIEEYLINPRKRIHMLLPRNRLLRYAKRADYRTWILLVLSLWIEHHAFALT